MKGMDEAFVNNLLKAAKLQDKSFESVQNSINNGINFISFITKMATMGYFCPESASHIFETVNLSTELEASETLEDILENGVKTVSRLGPKYDQYLLTDKNIKKLIQRKVFDDTTTLKGALSTIFVLDCLIETNQPTYHGVRLKQKMKPKLSKLLTRQQEKSIDNKLMNNILCEICKVLNVKLQQQTSYVYHGFLSPDSTTRDIAFCVDIRSSKRNEIKVLPLAKEYTRSLDQGLDIVRPDDYSKYNSNEGDNSNTMREPLKLIYKWFAISAPQNKFNSQCREDGSGIVLLDSEKTNSDNFYTNIHGPFYFKIKRLETLGYNVIPITHELLHNCKNKKSIHDVRKLINENCVGY